MTNPVPNHTITTPYGRPGSWQAGYHTGDDYAAAAGTPVVAARTGRLIRTGWDGSYGNQIVLESDGIRHSYNHLSHIQPGLGGLIQAGQRIGLVGSTGNSTGPHLHYEERFSPYGYWQHRKPEYNHETQEDDVSAQDVWRYPVADDSGSEYTAETYLRRVPRVADEIVSYRLTLPDGSKADLWTVLVDTLERVKRIEARLND